MTFTFILKSQRKSATHFFILVTRKFPPSPTPHHKKTNNELLGRAMAALSGIPSLIHATRFGVHHPHVLKNI